MKSLEERAMQAYGIPSALLMENAAMQVVKHGLELLAVRKSARVVVLCGGGNNGGDGLAAARMFFAKGVKTRIIYVGDRAKAAGDALMNFQIAEKMGIPIEVNPQAEYLRQLMGDSHLIVDALLGTGFVGSLSSMYAQVIAAANDVSGVGEIPIIAVDIPSGVEADTGRVGDYAIRAHTTITFGLGKVGLFLYPGAEYARRVVVADISIPPDGLIPPEGEVWLEALSSEDAAALVPPRPPRSNKGTYGQVCVLAGCKEMPGAALLCCKGAYKAGAGLVKACVVWDVAKVIQTCLPEAVTTFLPDKNGSLCVHEGISAAIQGSDVIALGSGLGRSPDAFAFARDIIASVNVPLVIDADGLMALAEKRSDENYLSLLMSLKTPCVITPHPGEMAALTNRTIPEITADTVTAAREFAKTYGVVTLLKDARTVIAAPDGRTFINLTGTPALAKAGTGDVLTGVIAAFIAQGLDVFYSSVLAAYLHGLAGELAEMELSACGVLASEVAEFLPGAMRITDRVIRILEA